MVSATPFFLFIQGAYILKEYLKAQTKTNESILSSHFSPDELNRFSKSDYRWADSKSKSFPHRTVKKGEVYQFEFGKNYVPEMSYEHRGLVIGIKQKLLYVLPIFSYDPHKHPDVYHPIDYPNSKSNMFLLKNSEYSFISHDSVLKLNDIRTVSISRILYQHNGQIPPSSDAYHHIENLVLQKYFPTFYHNFQQNLQTISKLNQQLEESKKEIQILKAEIKTITEKRNPEKQHHLSFVHH